MLTEEQAGTIENVDENKMIVALAGSGKTHTFISLVERILQENPYSTIAMVTFTNAATSEMEDRVKMKVGSMANRVSVSTFARLMRVQFVPLMNKRRLLIGGEYYGFIKRAMISQGVDLDELRDCLSEVDKLGRDLTFVDDGSSYSRVFAEYSNLLKRYGRYDLNLMARELIQALIEGKIKPIKQDFILIDEFQDTDILQYEWLKENSRNKKVAVVGDDDQSIYAWRGARAYEAFVDFQGDFNAEAYLLSQCFRCAPEILSTAKAFIEHNQDRIDKDMSSPKPLGGTVSIRTIPKRVRFRVHKEKK
ncbi:ATP-dependent helicase [Colwellia sp. MSW7]|uniref:ATP-dependent helicase n=1 Tax=Colwellia maritima TaxID=2912588 RepID=A0ABS9X8Z8_9GAMM|nr:ATP-dependent helicase [Colwellia maritima]MCI2285956.1 ATP-dependent helicase [Colwellia maritima]